MILHVFITLPDARRVHVGDMAFGLPIAGNPAPTSFRYSRAWLEMKGAFPLNPDPQSLPLTADEFHGSALRPPLRVFEDAVPDDWGRQLIVREKKLSANQRTPYWFLKHTGSSGMGALSFSESMSAPSKKKEDRDFGEVVDAAIRFDRGEALDDDHLRRLFAAGASPGGARPKVLAVDAAGAGWISKLSSASRDAGMDVVGLEYACMHLAGLAGLEVPAIKLDWFGGHKALSVRRFDMTPTGGRLHMISLSTLCGESGGLYCISYDEPAAAIRKYSDDPGADMVKFFRQMVFNAAVGNTDDHLKNFILLRGSEGYRLSPCFDILPDVGHNRQHTLAIGQSFSTPDRQTLRQVGARWTGLQEAAIDEIIDRVLDAVLHFDAVASESGCEDNTRMIFSKDIQRRVEIVGACGYSAALGL